MIKENKIRLVALINEITILSEENEYKIINFVPDILIKNVIEEGVYKRDSEGKYYFEIMKNNMFQIPYTKNLKDLSVIVGENGSGKTTIINKIFKESERGFDYLVFEQDNEIIVYREFGRHEILIQDRSKCFSDIRYESSRASLNVIKFSNAQEWSTGSYYIMSNVIDASLFKDINKDGENREIIGLLETINQIKFVTAFKDRISEFVDYTQKGVTVDFQGNGLPYISRQLEVLDEVDSLQVSIKEKDVINKRLIDYFSILINHTIHLEYVNNNFEENERLLKFHLSYLKNSQNITLQYKSIGIDRDRFLPQEYMIDKFLEIGEFEQSDYDNRDIWIEIWHLTFIMNLYFEYRRMGNKKNDEYRSEINTILDKLKKNLVKLKFYKHTGGLDSYVESIESFYEKIDDINYDSWKMVWEKIKDPCILVAKAIRYTSYFELKDYGYFVKHKLAPDRLWITLEEIGISNENIGKLKKIKTLLSKLHELTTDFETLTLLVNYVSEVEESEFKLNNNLQIRWKGMSSGELALLKSFVNLYSAKVSFQDPKTRGEDKENYLLLLDEVDLGLHPRWQRKWVSTALPIIEKIFEDKHLQIIITTHSPIFLSDIFIENIIFLTKGSDVSKERTYEKTFGQNIYTLFKNSFFLNQDELMGEYAYRKIKDTIEYLRWRSNKHSIEIREDSIYYEHRNNDEDGQRIARKIIDSVGERIIANQLNELFNMAYPNYEKNIADIEREIERLQNKLRNLKEGNSQ